MEIVKIDLLELLRQAIPQIFGSDEREILSSFIDRHDERESVLVTITLEKIVIDGPGG